VPWFADRRNGFRACTCFEFSMVVLLKLPANRGGATNIGIDIIITHEISISQTIFS